MFVFWSGRHYIVFTKFWQISIANSKITNLETKTLSVKTKLLLDGFYVYLEHYLVKNQDWRLSLRRMTDQWQCDSVTEFATRNQGPWYLGINTDVYDCCWDSGEPVQNIVLEGLTGDPDLKLSDNIVWSKMYTSRLPEGLWSSTKGNLTGHCSREGDFIISIFLWFTTAWRAIGISVWQWQ